MTQTLTPTASRLGQRLSRASLPPVWSVVGMVLVLKALLFLYGIAAYEVLANQRITSWRGALAIWNRWDAPHYLDLARSGYQPDGEIGLFIVFFPLFPWLTRLAALPFGDVLLGALLVSTVASLATGVLLYRLTALDHPPDVAHGAVWFLFIFPTAYFLHIGYTESLFLALTLGSLLAARSRWWSLAGGLGALAALTRMNGALLIPVLLTEAFLQYRQTRRLDPAWLWIGVVALGTGAYLLLNQIVTDDPFTFLDVQRGHWFRQTAAPWDGLRETVRSIEWRGPGERQMVGIQELLFAVLGLAGTVATWLRLRPSYGVWMTGNWILFTANSFVASVPRYTLAMFPLFILFALLARNRTAAQVLTVWSLLFFGLFAALFVQGRWAF